MHTSGSDFTRSISPNRFFLRSSIRMHVTIMSVMLFLIALLSVPGDSEAENPEKPVLSPAALEEIREHIAAIPVEVEREKARAQFEAIVSPNGAVDLDSLATAVRREYEKLSRMRPPKPQSIPADALTWPPSDGTAMRRGTSTEFFPPFDWHSGWENETGWPVYAAHGGHHSTGAASARAGALAGGATAEEFIRLNFYVGRTKEISIQGFSETFGGFIEVIPAAVASTRMTCMIAPHGNWDNGIYTYNWIDPPFTWEWFSSRIIWFVKALLPGSTGIETVDEAIGAFDLLTDLNDLNSYIEHMIELSEIDFHSVSGSFTAQPGTHTVGIGLRATASAFFVGTAHAGRAGAITSIIIDGIARPDDPVVTGPDDGVVGNPYSFAIVSSDPNSDDVQYYINWGDNTSSGWSGYRTCGNPLSLSHTYSVPGYYRIDARSRDIDQMESGLGSHWIAVDMPPDNTPPETWITDGPSGTIDYDDVSFTWTGSDDATATPDLEYSYRLDNYTDDWSEWDTTIDFQYSDLPNGTYTFRVKARDLAGNEDPTSATRSFTVDAPDTDPPQTFLFEGPSGQIYYHDVDFAWSGFDPITPPESLEYSFILEPYSGSWSSWTGDTTVSYNDLPDETYTFRVKARDQAHNEDPSPAELVFTIGEAPTGDEWPTFSHDNAHTGFSSCVTPDSGVLRWSYSTGGPEGIYTSSPAVSNGKVYFGSTDEHVYCLDAVTGDLIWRFNTNDWVITTPAVAEGKVYVGANDEIYCFNAQTGQFLWDYVTQYPVYSPTVHEGKVYFGSGDSLFCLGAINGDYIWGYQAGNDVKSCPAVTGGKVYFSSNDHSVYCLNAETGSEVWIFGEPGVSYPGTPAVKDDRVVFTEENGHVYCLNAGTGSYVWDTYVGIFPTDLAVGYVRILVGTHGHTSRKICCLSLNTGEIYWEHDEGYWIGGAPALADDKVYYGNYDGNQIVCRHAYTGDFYWDHTTGGQVRSAPAIVDGNVFVGSNDDNMYCFGRSLVPPVAEFTWVPGVPVQNQDVEFDAGESYDPDGASIASYEWDWNDDGTYDDLFTEPEATMSWPDTGSYAVRLRVTDIHAQTGSTMQVVRIEQGVPPHTPADPDPPDGAEDVSIDTLLRWRGGDPDADDSLTYFVYLDEAPDPSLFDIIGPFPATDTLFSYDTSAIGYGNTYYWQIKVWDNHLQFAEGAVWSFTAEEGTGDERFVVVPAGTFTMGDGVANCADDQHEVTLSCPYQIGRCEVTNNDYRTAVQWAYNNGYVTVSDTGVTDNLDGSEEMLLDLRTGNIRFADGEFYLLHLDRPNHPVLEVSWYGAAAYCDWLSLQDSLPRAYDHATWECNGGDPYRATGYRLPTEAEWERAARYDDDRIYPWGNTDPNCDIVNYYPDSGACVGMTTPVRTYPGAPLIDSCALYDMAGNVWEWCNDWHQCELGTAPQIDPVGPPTGDRRALRGGGWDHNEEWIRSAYRWRDLPWTMYHTFGFRIVGPSPAASITGEDSHLEQEQPKSYSLEVVAPNPFNVVTNFRFSIPKPADVDLRIYDVTGRLVSVVISEPLPAGRHSVTWKGRDRRGRKLAAGVYFIRLKSGEFTSTRSLMLIP